MTAPVAPVPPGDPIPAPAPPVVGHSAPSPAPPSVHVEVKTPEGKSGSLVIPVLVIGLVALGLFFILKAPDAPKKAE